MPDFNAKADVYVAMMEEPRHWQPTQQRQPVHSGTITECVRYVLTKNDGYPETYMMRVPLEAGFQTKELHYRDIETISKRSDFPRA
jgi:hypothetical protein